MAPVQTAKANSASNKNKEKREARKFEQRRVADIMKLISAANSTKDMLAYCTDLIESESIQLQCERVTNLDKDVVEWAVDLTARNMQKLYEESAWGWDAKNKRSEMTEDEAWYIVAKKGDKKVGFTHFRFDMDYGDAVLYCYELQVEEGERRVGVGRLLLRALERLAARTHMLAVRLTAFKHNPDSLAFFHKMGYVVDQTSPAMEEAAFYEILSKLPSEEEKELNSEKSKEVK